MLQIMLYLADCVLWPYRQLMTCRDESWYYGSMVHRYGQRLEGVVPGDLRLIDGWWSLLRNLVSPAAWGYSTEGLRRLFLGDLLLRGAARLSEAGSSFWGSYRCVGLLD